MCMERLCTAGTRATLQYQPCINRTPSSSIVDALENVLESYGQNICPLLVTGIKGLFHITAGKNEQIQVKQNINRGFRGGGGLSFDTLTL